MRILYEHAGALNSPAGRYVVSKIVSPGACNRTGKTKVTKFQGMVRVNQEVLGFNITVNYAVPVTPINRPNQLKYI